MMNAFTIDIPQKVFATEETCAAECLFFLFGQKVPFAIRFLPGILLTIVLIKCAVPGKSDQLVIKREITNKTSSTFVWHVL